jgi:formate hydrogenlyase transcriptional activator
LGNTFSHIEDVTTSDLNAPIFHPEDIEAAARGAPSRLSRGVPFEIEQRALRHDDRYRWFFIRYNRFHDGQRRLVRWYATGTDIEDRKRAEEKKGPETRTSRWAKRLTAPRCSRK